jgi:hypothetical protein
VAAGGAVSAERGEGEARGERAPDYRVVRTRWDNCGACNYNRGVGAQTS